MYIRDLILKLIITTVILTAQVSLATANPGIGVDVTPINPQVVPPETATYLVAVVSSSTETEMVTLSIVNPKDGWTYSFNQNDFELLAGETKNVELSITVPAGTANGDYFHDVRGFAVVPGFEGIFDEETFFLNVLTITIPEFPTIVLPVVTAIGMLFFMSKKKGK